MLQKNAKLIICQFRTNSIPADADTRGREWQQVARVGKQQEVANRPTQNDRDRGQTDHVSRCRMGSLAGFHCMVGAGPEK